MNFRSEPRDPATHAEKMSVKLPNTQKKSHHLLLIGHLRWNKTCLLARLLIVVTRSLADIEDFLIARHGIPFPLCQPRKQEASRQCMGGENEDEKKKKNSLPQATLI
ncbi:hypothetical protein TNIN_83721 [Trichonephila inaurata madagascariensis]|uniref:Uncharacterized protein n=1 Tax=Trichonephila inaurata madagascariensis TaxID=2747483 RepID=A0A8X7CSV7_9ARAC|nr:hypothetical protein TNIN_83721 [Trichonephila inaurata madagascariensis]